MFAREMRDVDDDDDRVMSLAHRLVRGELHSIEYTGMLLSLGFDTPINARQTADLDVVHAPCQVARMSTAISYIST